MEKKDIFLMALFMIIISGCLTLTLQASHPKTDGHVAKPYRSASAGNDYLEKDSWEQVVSEKASISTTPYQRMRKTMKPIFALH
jgi:hypothetical protein